MSDQGSEPRPLSLSDVNEMFQAKDEAAAIQEQESEKFICTICGQEKESQANLNRHVAQAHKRKKRGRPKGSTSKSKPETVQTPTKEVERQISVTENFLDITVQGPLHLTIRADGKVVWISDAYATVFRACQIDNLIIDDERKKK